MSAVPADEEVGEVAATLDPNVGSAHRPLEMKTGIRLSKMIVTNQSFRKGMP